MPKKIDKQKKHLDKLAAENLRQDREPEPSDSSVPTVVPPHLTSGPHDLHSLTWTFPSELAIGVYYGVTIIRLS